MKVEPYLFVVAHYLPPEGVGFTDPSYETLKMPKPINLLRHTTTS